jgi:hypothetical protein
MVLVVVEKWHQCHISRMITPQLWCKKHSSTKSLSNVVGFPSPSPRGVNKFEWLAIIMNKLTIVHCPTTMISPCVVLIVNK